MYKYFEQLTALNSQAMTDLQRVTASVTAHAEKLVSLNMAAAKAAVERTMTAAQAAAAAKAPQDAFSAQAAFAKVQAAGVVAHARAVYDLATQTGVGLAQVAQDKLAQGQKAVAASVEHLSRNAPLGTDKAVDLFKAGLTTGQQAFETAQATVKAVATQVEKQVLATADALSTAAAGSAKRK